MGKFNFYYKWLIYMSCIIIFLGLFIAFLKSTPLFIIFNGPIDPVFWGDKTQDSGTIAFKNFVYSLLGATMAAWGIQLLFILKNAFVKKEKWAWLSVLTSVVTMFIIDEGFSIYYKVYFNALFNIVFYSLVLFPVFMTRSAFCGNESGIKR